MKGLGKIYPPDTTVLNDIWLSFLPGAKIGVLGLNGAGKSTLLKIMAGVETELHRRGVSPARASRVGYLPQEPQLNPDKDVRGNVEEGVAEIKARCSIATTPSTSKLGEEMSPEEMEKVLDEQAQLQDRIDAANAWDLDSRLELAMDALRLPPADADVTTLSGGERRRVALCRLLLQSPDLLLLDEPTNHLDAESVAWLERFLKDYPGTVVAVTHDRYFLDNVAGWILELDRGSGIPYEGNYTGWLEQKQARLAQEEKTETQAAAHAAARAGLDSHVAARAPGQGQGAPQRLRAAARRGHGAEDRRRSRSTFRPARGSATSSSRRAACRRPTATRCCSTT